MTVAANGWEYLNIVLLRSDVSLGEAIHNNFQRRPDMRSGDLESMFRISVSEHYSDYFRFLENVWPQRLPDDFDDLDTNWTRAQPVDINMLKLHNHLSVMLARYAASNVLLWIVDGFNYSGWGVLPLTEDGERPGPDLEALIHVGNRVSTEYFSGVMHFLDTAGKAGWELLTIQPDDYWEADRVEMLFKRSYVLGSRSWESTTWKERGFTDAHWTSWRATRENKNDR